MLFASVFLLCGAAALQAPAARADFRLCNDTRSLVGVAIGYRDKEGWITEGWWRIPAESCASLIEGRLNSRFYYVFGEDADKGGQWRGGVFMCTSNKEFKIRGTEDCYARGYERTGFFEVDTTSERSNWLVRLTEAGRSGETGEQ